MTPAPDRPPPRRMRGEGGVSHRADGRWQGTIDLGWDATGKRKRRYVYGRTQAEVIKEMRRVQREFDTAGVTMSGAMTVAAFLGKWLDDIAAPRVKPKTLTSYASIIKVHLIPHLGRRRLDKLTPVHVREMDRAIEKDRSSSTALKAHAVLSKALTDAVRERVVAYNVAGLVDRPHVAVSKRGTLTAQQALVYLTHIEKTPNAARWVLAFAAGMRQGECLGLTREMVDLEVGTLTIAWQLQRLPYRHGCSPACGRKFGGNCPDRHIILRDDFEAIPAAGGLYLVRPKSKAGWRTFPLDPRVLTVLKAHIVTPNPLGLMFTTTEVKSGARITTESGMPIDPRRDLKDWHANLTAAGLPDVPLHAARHVALTALKAAGVDDFTIMSIAGHVEARTSHGYMDVSSPLQAAALGKLSEALRIGA